MELMIINKNLHNQMAEFCFCFQKTLKLESEICLIMWNLKRKEITNY